jgi:hypothetical protein
MQRLRTTAPVKEEWCRRLGELHRDHGELLDLPTVEIGRQDEPSPEMRRKGGKQGLCGGAADRRGQEAGGGGGTDNRSQGVFL